MQTFSLKKELGFGADDYLWVLKQYRLDFTERGPWATVGKSTRVQGWKLHLSSIPTEAISLLISVIPILLKHGMSFKIATSEKVLGMLNEGELGATQVGKFVTVYPDWLQAPIETVSVARQYFISS